MKNSANVVYLKKWKFTKKYGKLLEHYKYLILILVIPVIFASIFLIDKMIMKKVLSDSGIDYNQYCENRLENSIDEEFRENYKKELYLNK